MSLDDVKIRILSRTNLPGLIGDKVRLDLRTGHGVGLCPFHEEKSPSFHVYDDHYHCYGCKAHGDAISYVRAIEGLGFVEALRWLGQKYGIETPELDEARDRMGRLRQDASLYKMMLEAQEFYVATLFDTANPASAAAISYLTGRGFPVASIRDFGFGLTPPEGYGLMRHLRQRGYSEQDAVACSLATTSARDGRAFDFLRGRITIPILDIQGRVIAFGGRTMDGSQPKYLNSRESKLFDKSHTLFGLDRARKAMREKGRALVVEGYMDAMALWQAGFTEAVACLGTAFTEHQLKLLRNATGLVVLLFDGDGAGQKATLGAVNVALTVPHVQIKAAVLTGGADPDDFVRRSGPEALSALLDQSVDLLDFAVRERLKTTHSLGIPDLVLKEFVPWLAQVPDRLQRSFLTSRIAQMTGIPASTIEAQLIPLVQASAPLPQRYGASRLGAKGEGLNGPAPGVPRRLPLPPLDLASFDFFGHLFHASPGEIDVSQVRDILNTDLELGPEHNALIEAILAALAAGQTPAKMPLGSWDSALEPELAALIEKLGGCAKAFVCSDRAARLDKLSGHLRARKVKRQVAQLKAELPRLANDPARAGDVQDILRAIGELTRTLPS